MQDVSLPPAYVVRREGNSFTLFVCPHLGGGGSGPAGGWVRSSQGGGVRSSRGVRSSWWGGGSGPASWGGVGQVQPGGWVRSSQGRGVGQVQPVGGVGQVQPGGVGQVQPAGGGQSAGGVSILRPLAGGMPLAFTQEVFLVSLITWKAALLNNLLPNDVCFRLFPYKVSLLTEQWVGRWVGGWMGGWLGGNLPLVCMAQTLMQITTRFLTFQNAV